MFEAKGHIFLVSQQEGILNCIIAACLLPEMNPRWSSGQLGSLVGWGQNCSPT